MCFWQYTDREISVHVWQGYRLVTMENILQITQKITNRIVISSRNATNSYNSGAMAEYMENIHTSTVYSSAVHDNQETETTKEVVSWWHWNGLLVFSFRGVCVCVCVPSNVTCYL